MNNQHVVPKGDIWQVKGENKMRATKNFDCQTDAIAYGRKIAQNNNSELVIHGKNGRIRAKDSYGNDPCPPRDTTH